MWDVFSPNKEFECATIRSYQWWNIVNSNLSNKRERKHKRNSYIFIQENVFENVVCEMVTILFNMLYTIQRRVVYIPIKNVKKVCLEDLIRSSKVLHEFPIKMS